MNTAEYMGEYREETQIRFEDVQADMCFRWLHMP